MLEQLMLSAAQRNSLERVTAAGEKNVDLLRSFLEPRGIEREDAIGARLGCLSESVPGYERFQGKLVIPYLSGSGPVAVKFRCIEPHDCKAVDCQRYDAPDGQKARLYNAGVLVNGGSTVAVVEGELKARVVTDRLGIPAVGTSAGVWMEHWARCLADYDRVLVIADNDDAGLKHAKSKVMKAISRAELIVPPLSSPKIDDWFVAEGADAVRQAIGL